MSQENPTLGQATDYAKTFIKTGDMSKSFRAAFPESKACKEAIYVKASRLHKHDKITLRIKELTNAAKKRDEEAFHISESEIRSCLVKAMHEGLTLRKNGHGVMVPFSLNSTISAAAELNKMYGNHAATKVAIRNDDDKPFKFQEMPADAVEASRVYREMVKCGS
jgi:hypothetical protein